MKIEFKNRQLYFNENNKAVIYYDDFISFKEFIDELITDIKKANYYIDSNNDIKIDDYLFIDMNIDLKKEFGLSKTSKLRAELIKKSIDYIDNNDLDVNVYINESKVNELSNYLQKEISSEKYKINPINKIITTNDLIDSIYELEIKDEYDNSISSKNFNQWILSNVYVDMLLNRDIKNKIIIINDYDQYSSDNGQNILNIINKLEEDNIVILTTRNSYFLNDYSFIENIYFYNDNNLNRLLLNNTMFEKYILIKDYSGDELSFDKYEIMANKVISDEDISRAKKMLSISLKSIFSEFFSNKEIDVSFLNVNIYLLISLYINLNKDIIKSKLIYKNKLSKIIEYIFDKYV